ncbi:MAG TPA: hypothetical protein VNY52_10205 [Solirubrobacteraceae bacterium]|jgi:hypothetical protein|nr:hypothetical protein [Solirubrobacteraceae bacterium]
MRGCLRALLTTRGRCHALMMALALTSAWMCSSTGAAKADICPNENIRLEQTYGAQLPDCRAYEQVSPVEKNLSDAIGHADLTQVSPDGERVTFGSIPPFPGIPGASEYPTYLSTRAPDGSGWSTQGLLPASKGPQGEEPGTNTVLSGLTEDLSHVVLRAGPNGYLYNADNGQLSSFPSAEEGFVDASSDDSAILFASDRSLAAGAIVGDPNLYEWDEGRLSLVAPDAIAGPDVTPELRPRSYTEHTISADGSRVFYTSLVPGPSERLLYMREAGGEPLPISSGPAEWRAATPDGSSVFYTEGGASRGNEGLSGGLYRWTWRKGEPAPITTQIAPPSANVLGTLGISNDGAYVYFVAEGRLGGKNSAGEEAVAGALNLYEWHAAEPEPIITYIDPMNEPDNWRDYFLPEAFHPADGLRSSQVAPDGKTLLFSSSRSLTGYENQEHIEIFLFDATDARLTCVSCNPTGQPATTDSYLSHPVIKYVVEPPARERPFALHNMSEDGQRVFFQTTEALVPKDENNLSDVYEWEDGHLHLISSGQGDSPAYLGDASANGRDVFFFTRQPLVAQDQDDNVDLYDARADDTGAGGGIAAQNKAPPPPCIGEQCHGAIAPAPSFGTPASAAYLGADDPVSQPSLAPVARPKHASALKPKCRRGYRRTAKRGRCARVRTSRRGR